MRILFATSQRAQRVSKHLKSKLAQLGRSFPYSRIQSATAVMYGYANWNDLLGRCGGTTPSPLDGAIPTAEIDARAAAFASRLSLALSLPIEDAQVGDRSRGSHALSPHDRSLDRQGGHCPNCRLSRSNS